MIKADEFVQEFLNREPERLIQYAKVDPNYASGRPSLIFDGETTPTAKTFPYLSSYSPTPNDRVMVVGGTVVGEIL